MKVVIKASRRSNVELKRAVSAVLLKLPAITRENEWSVNSHTPFIHIHPLPRKSTFLHITS